MTLEHAVDITFAAKNRAEKIAQQIFEFTRTYLAFSEDAPLERELACLHAQYPAVLLPPQSGDRFVGRVLHAPVGFSPQMGNGFGYYLKEEEFLALLREPELSEELRFRLTVVLEFWRENHTAAKTRRAYSGELAKLLPSDNWNGESGIAFPLYRMAGSTLDYAKLMRLGIGGLRRELEEHMRRKPAGAALYRGLIGSINLLAEVCLWYAEKAQQSDLPAEVRAELVSCLLHISEKPPETLHQGLQLFWLYALLSGNANYGRFDRTFTDLFAADTAAGVTEENVIELLSSLWRLMAEREGGVWMFDSRVIIGGKDRPNEAAADRFALLCIETTRRMRLIMPQLSLRFFNGQNPLLYQLALDCISGNNPYPILYNDDVNIPAVAAAFTVSEDEATNYVPFGCGEYVIEHKSFGTPSGVINLLQALLVTLNHGIDPTRRIPMGIPADELPKIDTFDSLWDAYRRQVERHVEALAEQEALEYRVAAQTAPFLFFTLLMDDCLERGKALFDGGLRYLGGTLETYGNSNTADSLTAIRKFVFREKRFSLAQLQKMLETNFVGYARERRLLAEAPKYGNDLMEADEMLVAVDRHVFTTTRNQAQRVGLHSYLVVVINNNANTVMGRYTAASPDGRLAFTPMNNGNAPSSGADTHGITAFLNSIVKPPVDLHAGAVQNIKLSRELFARNRRQVEQLLEVYWEQGGAQAMLNVVGRNELEEALVHPEKYANLIVRVGGYSARFIDLAPDIQQEILARTLY
ncbi:MAG: hypothetical protein ONA69_02105 [candidate division KSB1 bacterium]|nr:hypothetical protein [candidate division KSB1 bacterium]MDZ7345567.1 hypothetical protein [candidate division KSB1 bacterium]